MPFAAGFSHAQQNWFVCLTNDKPWLVILPTYDMRKTRACHTRTIRRCGNPQRCLLVTENRSGCSLDRPHLPGAYNTHQLSAPPHHRPHLGAGLSGNAWRARVYISLIFSFVKSILMMIKSYLRNQSPEWIYYQPKKKKKGGYSDFERLTSKYVSIENT